MVGGITECAEVEDMSGLRVICFAATERRADAVGNATARHGVELIH